MSDDWDEDDLEGLDLEDVYEPQQLTPEDVFKMINLNKKRKIKLNIELRDKDNDKVLVSEVVEELLHYMHDKMKDNATSDFTGQIMPLMSQALVSGLGRLIGIRETGAILSNDILKSSMIQMMALALSMLKFIQKKNLKIYSYEEEISDEEIAEIEHRGKATKVAVMGELLGMDEKEVIKELYKQGKISKEEIEALTKEEDGDDDDGDKN